MSEHRYLHLDEDDEEELSRLRGQEILIDPNTIRYLETVGVRQGWKCLEVGAGTGSVAQWLSSRVGAVGKIVATDIDLRFLSRLDFPNLEVRRHNILRDDLEEGVYDLVHCRLLLEHLSNMANSFYRSGFSILTLVISCQLKILTETRCVHDQ